MRLFIPSAVLFCALATMAHADDSAFTESFSHYDPQNWYISNGWANGDWQACEWRADAITTDKGNLRLTLSDKGGDKRPIGCGETRTNRRFGYGLYETRMRAAKGSGLNTAFFTYIGPPNGVPEWDEIDFEFLGKDTHGVQVNYYTNGKAAGGVIVPLGYDASTEFHDYAFDWEPTKIRWYVDGKLVHESADGAALPHNPGSLFLSLWAGTAAEDNWLGQFHYEKPATAEVTWVAYTPPNGACSFPESMKCK